VSNLNFLKIQSSGQASEKLVEIITGQLSGDKSVLWLLSGGSAIGPAVAALDRLKDRDLGQLTISLVDERFGEPGHKNSNWQSLIEQGFSPGNAKLYPVLRGLGPKQTTAEFNQFLDRQLKEADFKLALLGIGADGHTAGILPGSPAVDSSDYAVYYEAEDYKRITITPIGLGLVDQAVVYCRGGEKAEAIANLGQDLPINTQPAQIIKQIAEVSVYNDIKGA
jgi:6-phosphogluconolactonase/glucosamine-6-phosphate isomerase/deaminase